MAMAEGLGAELVPRLGPALAERCEHVPIPVTLHASGLERHGRDAEEAVYFCVLEALQNAVRYAQATSIHVRLETRHGQLCFEVSDDGTGFDPTATSHGSGLRGMADRLDTLDGTLAVDSSPGRGTRITGTVPTPHRQQEPEPLATSTSMEA
jgi:two-component system, NarL family, sensor kinase